MTGNRQPLLNPVDFILDYTELAKIFFPTGRVYVGRIAVFF
jgi:hypothetical protein